MANTEDQQQPSEAEVREILEVSRTSAIRSGARGAEVEDIAQATALRIIQKWHRPSIQEARTRKRWLNYVALVARNAHIDAIRSEQRRRQRQERANDPATRPGYRPNIADDPEMEAMLTRVALEQQITKLPAVQQEIARLYFIDERTQQEIADITHRSVRTIQKHISLIRHKLGRGLVEPTVQEQAQEDPQSWNNSVN